MVVGDSSLMPVSMVRMSLRSISNGKVISSLKSISGSSLGVDISSAYASLSTSKGTSVSGSGFTDDTFVVISIGVVDVGTGGDAVQGATLVLKGCTVVDVADLYAVIPVIVKCMLWLGS